MAEKTTQQPPGNKVTAAVGSGALLKASPNHATAGSANHTGSAAAAIAPGSFGPDISSVLALVHPDDRNSVTASLQKALDTSVPVEARCRAMPQPGGERWLEISGFVKAAHTGLEPVGFYRDVTEQRNAELQLQYRASQQATLAQLGERALVEPDLERLLNDAATTVAVTLSVDFVQILELLPGDAELMLRAGFGWKADLVGKVIATMESNSFARYVFDSTAPLEVSDFASETRFLVPDHMKTHLCKSGVSLAINKRDAGPFGLLGVCTAKSRRFTAEETAFLVAVCNLISGALQRRQLELRHEMMIRDMRHRAGNLYSQILALFSQTARTSKSIADLSTKYQARLLAMANADRLITEGGWKSIPIRDLFNIVLGPYYERATFQGPNIDLEPDPVFNLSAALHELTGNAAKYGSLSRPEGRIEIRWSLGRTDRGVTLDLDWIEQHGPPTRHPRRSGFGTRLVDLVIRRQLNGDIRRTYARDGLRVNLVVPLSHERWPPTPDEAAAAEGDLPRGA
jgi:two-component sensor histidine kinase